MVYGIKTAIGWELGGCGDFTGEEAARGFLAWLLYISCCSIIISNCSNLIYI